MNRPAIGAPNFVYRPWSQARREAARAAAAVRLYGGVGQARRTRRRKLKALLKRRRELMEELGRVNAAVAYWTRMLEQS